MQKSDVFMRAFWGQKWTHIFRFDIKILIVYFRNIDKNPKHVLYQFLEIFINLLTPEKCSKKLCV